MTKFVLTGFLAMLCFLPGAAAAHSFTSLVVFGDSLSDSGRAFALSGGVYPPSPPYAGRFSNGPVASERLAATLGLPLAPAGTPGGTNYAVGGATTGDKNVSWETDTPAGLQSIAALQHTGMTTQMTEFLTSGPAVDRSRALFLVWGGPNDIVLAHLTGGDVAAAAAAAVGNLTSIVQTLALSGGQSFLVPNMVDLGATPEFLGSGLEGALRALVQEFNAGLALSMDLLEQGLEANGVPVDIRVFDTFTAFDTVLNNPQAFGFTNTTDQCVENLEALLAGCPGYVFFDFTHPTSQAHGRLGLGFAATVVPAPPAALLALAGAALLGLGRWRGRCD
ncbi:MAG TPA: SGNH/GDSL hydrolase family protein [Methylomirabilota bacterium]|nr:SGNH/GDSL hydrolase family protein [Methylomirabilota bacterium]